MAKREELQERRRRNARRQRIVVVGIIAAVIIVVGAILLIENRQGSQSVTSFVQITPVAYLDATGRQMGNPNAPVTMQEFADFQ